MNNKDLEKIKREYNDIKTIINSDFKEMSELGNNPIIKRYNYLKQLQMLAISGDLNDDHSIVKYCLMKNGIIEETNNIYVYMFENTIKRLEKIFSKPILESEEDKSKIAVYYVDLENTSKCIFVPKEKQEEFEKVNTVVIGNENIYDSSDRYYNLRREFFDLCVQQNQEQAVQLVLQKYKRKV